LSAIHLAFLYFIAGYFRLHPRMLPWIVIVVLFCLSFRMLYSIRRYSDFYRKWMERHRMGLWKCHVGSSKWMVRSNLASIICAMLSLCVCAGLYVPAPIGSAFTFLGSLSFASYLIHVHPAWSWKISGL
jgi:hypothetical protein